MNVKYYDVIVKFPEGVLADTVSQLDNFDVECLDIGLKEETPPNIRDRYCLGEVTVKVPEAYLKRYYSVWQNFRLEDSPKESISELYWGICVPVACALQDVKDVIGRVLAVAFSES
ncbi:hypothetical protein V1478_005954 [Vespula squamosa]|uniref:Nose resistant-to-fluoxetine protein N-terminal domain-containing protein n=1 Tax=Vespula squamosa TaxID=30214 RepID=A0ABD2B8Z8_VESSQ